MNQRDIKLLIDMITPKIEVSRRLVMIPTADPAIKVKLFELENLKDKLERKLLAQ